MSFGCVNCGESQEDGSIPILIQVERRNKKYPERYKDSELIDKGGQGYETVKEIQVCETCAIIMK